jgi:RsiW-degrading membrane proteinase PrsW (M82 family)
MTVIEATDDALLTARADAIERSGWGSPFRFVQPRNLGFWVYLVLVGWGALGAMQTILPGMQTAQSSLAATAVVFALYSLPFIVFLRQIDRFRTVPAKLALAAFVYGGVAATMAIAINGNNALFSLYSKLGGAAFGEKWGAALSAPFMEELGKASGLLLLILLAPRRIRTAFDGLLVGSFLGLGFQIVENVIYGFRGGNSGFDLDNVQSAIQGAVMRLGTGVFSHWLYSGIFCAGLVWFLGRPEEPARRGRGVLLMVLAMVGHGLWDAGSGLLSISIFFLPLGYVAVPLALVLTYRWIYRTSVTTGRQWAATILEPEVVSDVATDAEVAAFVGSRRDRKAYLHTASGHRGHVGARHVMEALRDLLLAVCHSHGSEDPTVSRARSEVLRLRGSASVP